jgi:hypothetical protein
MEPAMTFDSGKYYVGDVGCVLLPDDLRGLFSEVMYGGIKPGTKPLIASMRCENGKWVTDPYWVAVLPMKRGTLYDQNNEGWGFDWNVFGVIPCKWIQESEKFVRNTIEFTESFTCSFTDDSITIGHLHFTFNPK